MAEATPGSTSEALPYPGSQAAHRPFDLAQCPPGGEATSFLLGASQECAGAGAPPLTPVSVRCASAKPAGCVRIRGRRRAAVGTAAAVAATSPNWGWGSGPYYTGTGGGANAANAYYVPPAASSGNAGWYITGSGMACPSGMWVTGGDGLPSARRHRRSHKGGGSKAASKPCDLPPAVRRACHLQKQKDRPMDRSFLNAISFFSSPIASFS
jgi:hypothetical protein